MSIAFQTTAQLLPATRDYIDSLAEAFIEQPATHALSIGIAQGNTTSFLNYGQTSTEEPSPPSEHSIYTIGSVTKTFTALALAKMVMAKTVALDDPIRRYLPDSAVGWPEERSMTLEDLAVQHSGLPRMPLNFTTYNSPDPYRTYGPDDLYTYLKSYRSSTPKRRSYQYSNLGFGLLGTILAEQAETSYPDLMQALILNPYGLEETYAALPPEGSPILPAHNAVGQPSTHWTFDALAGAGAMFSTTSDLVKYGRTLLQDSAAFELLTTAYRTFGPEDRPNVQGLAWIKLPAANPNRSVWFHNGQTNGGHAFLVVIPEDQLVFAALTNSAVDSDPMCFKMLRALVEAVK